MANICSNWLTILSEDKKELVCNLFKEMVEKHTDPNTYYQFEEDDKKGMDNINADNDSISYETPWATNEDDIIKLAKKHKFNFKLEYEELGCNYFGFVVYDYEKDELTEYHLDEKLMKLVKTDKHGEYYLVDKDNKIRGEVKFDSLSEYYEFLLEEQYKLGHS
jgi:hypothetical protein